MPYTDVYISHMQGVVIDVFLEFRIFKIILPVGVTSHSKYGNPHWGKNMQFPGETLLKELKISLKTSLSSIFRHYIHVKYTKMFHIGKDLFFFR